MVRVSFDIPADAPPGVVPLGMANALVAQATGQRVEPLTPVDGAVTVVAPGQVAITLGTGPEVLIQIRGTADWRYAFEASTNLTHWDVLEMIPLNAGTTGRAIAIAPEEPQRFFRARPVF
jgi:hypothetical protein